MNQNRLISPDIEPKSGTPPAGKMASHDAGFTLQADFDFTIIRREFDRQPLSCDGLFQHWRNLSLGRRARFDLAQN
ncbi:MAG TPA: hypothetical protein VMU69_01600 [Bradyrhizobium sp.]|nr:hypothetical protein [Bradyrhizobium sp.]